MPFMNINLCRSYNGGLSTTLARLSAEECTEVLILNKTGQDVEIYDGERFEGTQAFLIGDDESVTIRGITNSEQVSAKTTSGNGKIYFRTQFYSMFPQR